MRRTATSSILFLVLAAAVVWGSPLRADDAAEVRLRAYKDLDEGVAAYTRGDFRAAVEALSRSADRALDLFRAHFYLGLALIGDRRYEEAIEALQVALDLEANHLGAHVAMGDAQLLRGDLGEATASYYRVLGLRPEYSAALDGIARVHEARGRDAEAITFYERAIASNRGYPDAYTHLGDLYLRKGRLDDAVRLLSEAVRIRPDFPAGLNRLAAAYGRLGLANEAVATIQRAIELEPGSADHRVTLGRVQLEMGLLDQAEASLREALARSPQLAAAHEGIAEVLRRRGIHAGAAETLTTALSDPRLDSTGRARLEQRLAAVREEGVRLATLEQAIAGGQAAPQDVLALAAIEAGRGNWARAAELQSRVAAEGRELERLAWYLLEAGRPREALAVYERLGPAAARPDLEINRGVALAALGDDAGATQRYRAVLAADAGNAVAQLYLGNALLRLGRTREAADAYVSFLRLDATGERAERVRRVLRIIAPEALAALPGGTPPAPIDIIPPPGPGTTR